LIRENVSVSDKLTEVIPDLLITAPQRTPVAIFLSQSHTRVYEPKSVSWQIHQSCESLLS
jgi:hypothetical protein